MGSARQRSRQPTARQRSRQPANQRYRFCGHCGAGVGLAAVQLDGGRLDLCAACRERLALARAGDPDWRWLLRALDRKAEQR